MLKWLLSPKQMPKGILRVQKELKQIRARVKSKGLKRSKGLLGNLGN